MHRTSRTAIRLLAAIGLTLSFTLVTAGASARTTGAHHGNKHGNHGGNNHGRHFDHIFQIMMENTGYNTIIGNSNAPWINWAAQHYGLAEDYYGVTHPSQPNYIAATSGSLNGVNSDNDTIVDVPNIVDQLEAKHKTWHAYMQSLNDCVTGVAVAGPVPGYKNDHACGNTYYGAQLYQRKHNPFVSYTDVETNPARMANIVDLSRLKNDLNSKNFPNYAWISPDQCHDMHGVAAPTASDPCDFSQEQSLIKMGDTFLKSTVNEIMGSRVWRDNSVIFITWDEADYTGSGYQGFGDDSGCCDSPPGQGGGRVVTLVIPSRANHGNDRGHGKKNPATGWTSTTPYNHYSMLATIEDNWNLGCLAYTCDTANVKPMTDLINGGGGGGNCDRHDRKNT